MGMKGGRRAQHTLEDIYSAVMDLYGKVNHMVNAIALLESKLGPLTDAVQVADTLLESIPKMIRDAVAGATGSDPALVSRITAVADALDANKTNLLNATAAGQAPPTAP